MKYVGREILWTAKLQTGSNLGSTLYFVMDFLDFPLGKVTSKIFLILF